MALVYVLGAGSSVVAGAPTIATFRAAARDTAAWAAFTTGAARDRFLRALVMWDTLFPESNIEEAYVLTELLDRLRNPEVEEEHSEDVRYLIAKTLETKMRGRQDEPTVHSMFADLGGLHAPDTTTITLNWDLALESNAAMHVDYGYSKTEAMTPSSTRSVHRDPIRLLKLHGSFNWWFCPSCGKLYHTHDQKDILWKWEGDDPRLCPSKDHAQRPELLPVMVPPTSQKFESGSPIHPVLWEVWRKAQDALRTCEELVIVGYSFPPTDVQFRMFLLHALSLNKVLKKVVVVTSPKYGSEQLAFVDHYSAVFHGSPHHHRLGFRFIRFEEWVREERCRTYEAARW